MVESGGQAVEQSTQLISFLRHNHDLIVERWARRVRAARPHCNDGTEFGRQGIVIWRSLDRPVSTSSSALTVNSCSVA